MNGIAFLTFRGLNHRRESFIRSLLWLAALVAVIVATLAAEASARRNPQGNPQARGRFQRDSGRGAARFAGRVEIVPYYGATFYERVRAGEKDEGLKRLLFLVLAAGHVPQTNGADRIVESCGKVQQQSLRRGIRDVSCYSHAPLTYDQARDELMGRLYLENRGNQYAVRDVYCEQYYTDSLFPRGRGPAPGQTPADKILNTEHTWPQSRFSNRFDKKVQQSDLHHLFPTDSRLNSIRSSFPFGEVDQPINEMPCNTTARFGHVRGERMPFFEPPDAHKGNVARALFYFAVRYQMDISPEEEAFLRKWHREDPPDDKEIARHEEIFELQRNRNPFIDFPTLVDRIGDF